MANGEFNLQEQQLNSLSLQRNEMFIATSAPKNIAPLGAKPGGRTFAEAGKSHCAPTELRSKETTVRAINISPLWGEATSNVLLHFQLEFANEKCQMTNAKSSILSFVLQNLGDFRNHLLQEACLLPSGRGLRV
jgi:hypothetical protein